jgi:hypothetical protein
VAEGGAVDDARGTLPQLLVQLDVGPAARRWAGGKSLSLSSIGHGVAAEAEPGEARQLQEAWGERGEVVGGKTNELERRAQRKGWRERGEAVAR